MDNEINVLNIAHEKPLKTAVFCPQVYLQFFTAFFHSPVPFARCEKLGYYMLIKMSEIFLKNTDQEMIFLFEQDLAEQK